LQDALVVIDDCYDEAGSAIRQWWPAAKSSIAQQSDSGDPILECH
jgi:hypothetical protein